MRERPRDRSLAVQVKGGDGGAGFPTNGQPFVLKGEKRKKKKKGYGVVRLDIFQLSLYISFKPLILPIHLYQSGEAEASSSF